MVANQPRACEYSSERQAGIETLDQFMQNSVPFAQKCLEEFSEKYAQYVTDSHRIATCKHKKKRFASGYKVTGTGYLHAADVKLETPTMKVDADDDDDIDEFFRSGAVFLDKQGKYHIVEYYNSRNGFYAVDRGIFDAARVATMLARAYADRVGPHSNFFFDCFKGKLETAKATLSQG